MDNLENFLQWKNPEEILDTANILVYPRLGHSIPDWAKENKKVSIIDTPIIELSSTLIRHRVKAGLTISSFVPEVVAKIIEKEAFYRS